MGKLQKNKDTVRTGISKASIKTTPKPKKALKAKKIVHKSKVLENGVTKKVKQAPAFSIDQFKKGIEAMLQYLEKNNSKDLFTQEKPMFLQIEAIRIPICPDRQIRIKLKNTLLTDKQEVCLIVPDLKKGRNLDHEPTIEHYEELFRSKNVKSIKRILPIRQLRVEYDQFELKRRLCGYYDYFLVSGNISGHVTHLLGKTFISKRKTPVPVKLDSGNLDEHIENALKKTVLHIHPKGPSFVVQFGHSEMSSEQLTENLKSVADKLVTEFPGGWANIRALHIKTTKSIAIPVYYTLKSANKVNVPVIKSIRPKKFEKITDEITTKEFGSSEITVHPGGRVEFKKTRQTGPTKNQLRKIKQGRIHKQSVILQAKRDKQMRKVRKNQLKLSNLSQENLVKTVKLKKHNRVRNIKQRLAKKAKKNNGIQVKVEVKTENSTPKIKQEKIKIKQEKIEIKSEGSETTAKKQKKKIVNKQNTVVTKQNGPLVPKQLKEKQAKVVKHLKVQAKNQKKTKANKENSPSQTLVKSIKTKTLKQKNKMKQKNKTVDALNLKTQKTSKKNKKTIKSKGVTSKNIVNVV